jgi:hypothetical protein
MAGDLARLKFSLHNDLQHYPWRPLRNSFPIRPHCSCGSARLIVEISNSGASYRCYSRWRIIADPPTNGPARAGCLLDKGRRRHWCLLVPTVRASLVLMALSTCFCRSVEWMDFFGAVCQSNWNESRSDAGDNHLLILMSRVNQAGYRAIARGRWRLPPPRTGFRTKVCDFSAEEARTGRVYERGSCRAPGRRAVETISRANVTDCFGRAYPKLQQSFRRGPRRAERIKAGSISRPLSLSKGAEL